MIRNDLNVMLTPRQEKIVREINFNLKNALGDKQFYGRIIDEYGDRYIQLILPLKPEDGSIIEPLEIEFMDDDSLYIEYTAKPVYCDSRERGYKVANDINESMPTLDIKCVYISACKEFEIYAITNAKNIVKTINSILNILEDIIVVSKYLEGDDSFEAMSAFDHVYGVSDFVNKNAFEFYNIASEKSFNVTIDPSVIEFLNKKRAQDSPHSKEEDFNNVNENDIKNDTEGSVINEDS